MRTLSRTSMLALAVVFLTVGFAATSYGTEMEIGFARVNINPPTGIRMSWQKFTGIESDLYASAMSLSDGATEVMIVSCDVIAVSDELSESVAGKIERALGIPAANIVVCAIHTHSGPPTRPVEGNDIVNAYYEKLKAGILEALTQAHHQARKGKLTLAYGEFPGYAFNRRFIMSDRTVQTHPLTLDPHIVGPEGPHSKELFAFCAYDADGKPIGAAVNFACHATVMERRNRNVSADYPGKVCRVVNEKLGPGVLSLFLQGACGNICQVNPLDVAHYEVGAEWTGIMGRAIGGKAVELMKTSAMETNGPLRVVAKEIALTLRKVDPLLAQWARNHQRVPAKGYSQSDFGAERYNDIELPKKSLSDWFEEPSWANQYAGTVRSHLEYSDTTAKVSVTVFAQDNWALVALPGEFFIEFAHTIRQRSPFEKTVVVGYANGAKGYFPTRKAFSRGGGYETNIGTARFTPDAGYRVVDAVIEMLRTARDK